MAITFGAHLGTQYDNVDRNSYSFTVTGVTSGRVAVLSTYAIGAVSTTPLRPTPSGLGMTWVFVNEIIDTVGTARQEIACWTGTGTPSGTTLTLDFGGVTHTGCGVSLSDWVDVNTTTPIVQSGTATGTSTTGLVTLGSAPTSGAVWGSFTHFANEAVVAGASFTLIGSVAGSTPNTGYGSDYQLANDQTVDMTWTTSAEWFGVAVELNPVAAGGIQPPRSMHQYRLRRVA